MLKSTYKKPDAPAQGPASVDEPGLPEGWTAHKAPNGHLYYYNAQTKKSTYVKPQLDAPRVPIPSYGSGQFAGGFGDGNFPIQHQQQYQGGRGGWSDYRGGHRGGYGSNGQRRPPPEDKPKHRYVIPSCKPWVLVKTKLGRRFVHNAETGESLWKFPEDVLLAVTDWDIKERERKERRDRGEESEPEEVESVAEEQEEDDEGSSEYTEVTDSEGEDDDNGEPSKRRRIDEELPDGPMEFNEDDLAAELEAMGSDEFEGEWDDDEEEDLLSPEEAKKLFFDLFEDFRLQPFSTWDKIIEQGSIIDDIRYIALPNMKARREAWDEWSKQKIQAVKERRATQEKTDPKIPYLVFLQENASSRLYWPEFKRKYRKEPVMKDMKVPDKTMEKFYREHIKRIQLPQSTLKKELTALLKALPRNVFNRDTLALPTALISDLKYYSLAPEIRDSLVQTYMETLPRADTLTGQESEAEQAESQERSKRAAAMLARKQQVEEEKKRHRHELAYGKQQLRQGEMELERARNVGRSGLQTQLAKTNVQDD